ncbi:ribosomal protein L21-like protein [Blastocladiella britannica]|nr:ribosomal protein L21-like protein [Blastocladiella britannica]
MLRVALASALARTASPFMARSMATAAAAATAANSETATTNNNTNATETESTPSPYVAHLAATTSPLYALLEVKGRPYHVTRGDLLTIPKLKGVPLGAELALDKVREIGSREISLRGAPYVAPGLASVKAVVIEHWLSDKRQTVKTKRRKGYKRTYGHRQHLTSLRVTEVGVVTVAEAPSPL